jgi:hypothetical protein
VAQQKVGEEQIATHGCCHLDMVKGVIEGERRNEFSSDPDGWRLSSPPSVAFRRLDCRSGVLLSTYVQN